jgi:hypothetical protein
LHTFVQNRNKELVRSNIGTVYTVGEAIAGVHSKVISMFSPFLNTRSFMFGIGQAQAQGAVEGGAVVNTFNVISS